MGCASCKHAHTGKNKSRGNVISYPAINGITFFENTLNSESFPQNENENETQPEPIYIENPRKIVPRKVIVHTHLGPGEIPTNEVILYWTASRTTERYHWWPLLDQNGEEEDTLIIYLPREVLINMENSVII